MAQYIKQGNLFGRIGSGIGKGLAEQLPQEIDRGRLAQGLKSFETDHQNLTPIQQLSRLSAIPGITPQMIQSFGELAKIQNQGNAFNRAAGRGGPNASQNGLQDAGGPYDSSSQINASPNRQMQAGSTSQPNQMPLAGAVNNNQRTPNLQRNQDIPQVTPGNALNKENLPRSPWSPQQRNSAVADYINQGFLPDQARQLASDDEARYLQQPEAYRSRLEQVQAGKDKANESLKRHLETKLQKTDKDVYKDVEGPMIINTQRAMQRDLIEHPDADIDNVANDWSERLYRTAMAKDKLRKLGETTGFEALLKGNEANKNLKEFQDIFKRSGNLEEFNNILQGDKFGMSPQGSALIAFPPSQKISSYISSHKTSSVPDEQKARKAAVDIGNLGLGPDDSILAIARSLSNKDPFFDQRAFFDQISEDKDRLGLNYRQRQELAETGRDILPNWADLLYLPLFRR